MRYPPVLEFCSSCARAQTEASFARLRQLRHFRSRQQCSSSSPMPPWAASVPRLMILRTGRAIDRLHVAFPCHIATKPSFANLRARSASTHVSPTAINLRPNIPPRNQELYDALSALSGAAETYVNISRLQLALRGLAAQDAVTRVAGMVFTESGEGYNEANVGHSAQPK